MISWRNKRVYVLEKFYFILFFCLFLLTRVIICVVPIFCLNQIDRKLNRKSN